MMVSLFAPSVRFHGNGFIASRNYTATHGGQLRVAQALAPGLVK